MTGDAPRLGIDPSIPPGAAYVFLENETAGLFEEGRRVRRIGTTDDGDVRFASDEVQERFNEMWKRARSMAIERKSLVVPLIQQPTMEAFVKAFEGVRQAARKTQVSLTAMLDILGHHCGRARKPRAVRPIPAIVPPGLSRVDSARARAARSALLRSRRRAIRHNRALPPRPRARIHITDPKITWDGKDFDPFRDRSENRLDAARFALTAIPGKD